MAPNLPADVIHLIAEQLTFRGVVALSGVCEQWRRAIKARPQLINKFFPTKPRDVDEVVSKLACCPLRRGAVELVPTWQFEVGDSSLIEPGQPWPTNEEKILSIFKESGSVVHREGYAPKFFASENDDVAPLEHFAYGDGMVAWQATPSAIVVDDLRNGVWDTFESPLNLDQARISAVSRNIAVLEAGWGSYDLLDHQYLVLDLATGCHAQYRFADGQEHDVKLQVQDENLALCFQTSTLLETKCVQLRMSSNDLHQRTLLEVQNITVAAWANAFFDHSGNLLYTVHHEEHTVIVTGYRDSQECCRYDTSLPATSLHAGPPPFDRSPKCCLVDSNGTWVLYSELRFIPNTKTSLYFNVASRRFSWRHIPDALGKHWDGYFDQPVCWNGWAYSYDFTPNDYGYGLTSIRRLTAQACSDLLTKEALRSDWDSEDRIEHDLTGPLDVDVVWNQSLFVDDEFLVFPTTQGAGYCVVQMGEKKRLSLRRGKRCPANCAQGTLAQQSTPDREDELDDASHGDTA